MSEHMHHMSNLSSGGHDMHVMHQGMDHSAHGSHIDGDSMARAAADVASGSCSGGAHAGHGMAMAFHGGFCETILFDTWKISSIGGLIGSMIGIMIMASLYEGLKYYREYLFWKSYNALQYRSVSLPNDKNVVAEDNTVVHVVGEVIHKQPPTIFSSMHFFQTFLHIVQIILSYFLMLIFMTYNTWLCLAVIIGAAAGYFLFGWKKSVIVDVTEHCH